jgi:predicted metal-dependent HD superfamily phosphohydrolase
VLERFLSCDRLYFCDYFHARLEAQARRNLTASLVALRAHLP